MQLGLSLLGPSVEVLGFLSHALKSLIIIKSIFIDKTDINKSLFSEQGNCMSNGKKNQVGIANGQFAFRISMHLFRESVY